jgi:hypothetical protein
MDTWLIMVVCLVVSPTNCHDEQPIQAPNMMACLIDGQQVASEWLDDHPKWMLKGYRCRLGPPEEKS